ncbi:uncharacterized protein LOC106764682 isoform X2 [Vigna radiata var. radiata]|nr:uncharacterized protein LOC106764682 isoform X2 [Vigna radiata var. radiata]XP_022637766.1 uncharacterized protein LOC106764682 isoform X2 [Vigna radiata var. radiata]
MDVPEKNRSIYEVTVQRVSGLFGSFPIFPSTSRTRVQVDELAQTHPSFLTLKSVDLSPTSWFLGTQFILSQVETMKRNWKHASSLTILCHHLSKGWPIQVASYPASECF